MNIRQKIISLVVSSLVLTVAIVGAYQPTASALFTNSKGTACQALGGSCSAGEAPVKTAIANVVGILSFVVGAAAVIMIFVGAFRYITSNGDSNQISSAKNTIIYSLIGLAVAALAQAIVAFVFKRL